MTKPKTLDQLRAEKERAETQLAQEQHKLERLENRKKYLEKGERTKRTHRLCNLGGTIESLAPEVKDLTRTEMTELMEHIFSLSEVQRAVWQDGLDFYRSISEKWKEALAPGGRLYFEVGIGQADNVLRIMRTQGFGDIQVVKDHHDIPRVVFGTLCTEL